MMEITRRKVLGAVVPPIVILLFCACLSDASDQFNVEHPLMPPSTEFSGQCPVCGMMRAMWARTWIEFDQTDGDRASLFISLPGRPDEQIRHVA